MCVYVSGRVDVGQPCPCHSLAEITPMQHAVPSRRYIILFWNTYRSLVTQTRPPSSYPIPSGVKARSRTRILSLHHTPPSHLQALARPPELKPLLCRMGLMQHVRPRLCPWCNDSDREALLVGKAIQHPPPAPAATAPLAAARSPRGLCSESESSSGSGRPCSNIEIKDRRRVSADGFAHPGTLLVICTSVHH